jgi:hypothetical protein
MPRHAPPRRRSLVALLGILLLGLLAAGCSSAEEQRQPVLVVEQFVVATERRDLDAMIDLVEPVIWRKQVLPELQQAMTYVEDIRYAEPRFDLLDNNGSLAHVRFRSQVTIDLREREPLPPREIDQTFELIRLEGRWYIRSLQLPLPEGE